jgi:hypothetical protein
MHGSSGANYKKTVAVRLQTRAGATPSLMMLRHAVEPVPVETDVGVQAHGSQALVLQLLTHLIQACSRPQHFRKSRVFDGDPVVVSIRLQSNFVCE